MFRKWVGNYLLFFFANIQFFTIFSFEINSQNTHKCERFWMQRYEENLNKNKIF